MSSLSRPQLEPVRVAGGHRAGPSGGQWRGGLAVVVTLLVLVVVAVGAAPLRSVVHVYLGALVALGGYAAAVAALSSFGRVERRRRSSSVPGAVQVPLLGQAGRRLELAESFAVQFEQLRAVLREVAEQRLAGRGLRLESAAARGLLGEEPWQLLERPLAGDKFGPGPRREQLRGLLDGLERL